MAKGYKIDFTNDTIIMNYTFAAAAAEYGSEEYLILKNIHKDFPEMKDVIRSGRNRKKAMKNKNLTYKNMISYIKTLNNSEELLDNFQVVKERSHGKASPYKYVKDWFVSQFPNYSSIPEFEKERPNIHAA